MQLVRSVISKMNFLVSLTRRAQEMDAAIWGTRAAVIGGANGTSNVCVRVSSYIPLLGTHAHAFGYRFMAMTEAFSTYALRPTKIVFLVDTYDTLRIGVPAAIQVARELGDQINFMCLRRLTLDIAYIFKRKSVRNWMRLVLQRLRYAFIDL